MQVVAYISGHVHSANIGVAGLSLKRQLARRRHATRHLCVNDYKESFLVFDGAGCFDFVLVTFTGKANDFSNIQVQNSFIDIIVKSEFRLLSSVLGENMACTQLQ